FGFVLAPLDLREHSTVHERAVGALLAHAKVHDDYANAPEEERVALLAELLGSPRPLASAAVKVDEESYKSLEFRRVVRWAKERYGTQAIGSTIVSFSTSASDVLEALLLAKEAGLPDIDATPLFETLDDLGRAPAVMRELLALPVYRRHVDERGVQEVMIGY